ncbi:LysM domain-containing protein [Opitutaceae bacterium TAV4]|nr:LysM domain-containing protein [Opitutaceae bacterium TAV4]
MAPRRRFLQAAGLALLGLALTPSTLLAAAERVHLVRRGETLSAIARRYGVSVAALGRVGIKSGAGFLPAFRCSAGVSPAILFMARSAVTFFRECGVSRSRLDCRRDARATSNRRQDAAAPSRRNAADIGLSYTHLSATNFPNRLFLRL